MNYIEYYKDFLGINNNENILFSSPCRNMPINNDFYYPLIISNFNKTISVSPDFYQDIAKLEVNDDFALNSLEIIKRKIPQAEIKKFFRFSTNKVNTTLKPNNAFVIKENHKNIFMKTGKNLDPIFKEKKWLQLKPYIDKEHFFAIIKDEKIVSSCKISDIYCNGANLFVFTDESYRGFGYGKEVVNLAITQCLKNNLLPIYFVEKNNLASINLAKSVGFEQKNEEISICFKK